MNYPVVIHKDKGSDYGVTVPDLPGCFSAGPTVDEALAMAREAIELHLEGLIEEGMPIPGSAGIEQHKEDPDYADGVWAIVTVDESNLRLRAKRVNITLPERVLDAVDRCAKAHGQTRSGLLARAAVRYMADQGGGAKRRPAFRGKDKLDTPRRNK
jgi:predicted RNase H-like HicB family nuclease